MPADAPVCALTEGVEGATAQADMIGFDARSVAIAVRRALGASTAWSDHTFEILQPGPLAPRQHLALDQVPVEELAAARRGPIRRLWAWTRSAGIAGSGQWVRHRVDLAAAVR